MLYIQINKHNVKNNIRKLKRIIDNKKIINVNKCKKRQPIKTKNF